VISDSEREEIVAYMDVLMAHLVGYSFDEKNRRVRWLINDKLKNMQSGNTARLSEIGSCVTSGKIEPLQH
jgi:hypothetical protein